MGNKTIIRIEIELDGEQRFINRQGNVIRTVFVNNSEVYSDRMSERMYTSCSDPIRKLELFLLGLKQGQSGKNSTTYAGKLICFIKQIWRKVF